MSLAPFDILEHRELARVQSGELRIVSAKRARKLRKRGENVWWNYGICARVWSPWWARADGATLLVPMPANAELCGARRASEPTPGYAGDNNGE